MRCVYTAIVINGNTLTHCELTDVRITSCEDGYWYVELSSESEIGKGDSLFLIANNNVCRNYSFYFCNTFVNPLGNVVFKSQKLNSSFMR